MLNNAGAKVTLHIEFDVAGRTDSLVLIGEMCWLLEHLVPYFLLCFYVLFHDNFNCTLWDFVSDSIVPSSGIFNVKLYKRGAGLGITISCKCFSVFYLAY